MKKNDFILMAVIMIVALVAAGTLRIWQKNNTGDLAVAVVTIDGALYGEYPLSEDVTERIELPDGSFNVLVISGGYADVTEASCPDQICVHHSRIRYSGESIVCLPNKLIVEVKGGEESEADTSTY